MYFTRLLTAIQCIITYLALPRSFYTARRTITGYETMNQIRKGQVCGVAKGDTLGQVKFIAQIFGVAA